MTASAAHEQRASAREDEPPLTVLRYIDVVLVVFAAPVLLLIGVPALGYLVGAGAWIVLRAAEVVVDRRAHALGAVSKELSARLIYVLGRVILLALAIILVRKGAGKDEGLTTLLVILFAFTVYLGISIVTRPGSR